MVSAKIEPISEPELDQRRSALDPHEAFVQTGQQNRLKATFPCDNGRARNDGRNASSETPEQLAGSGPTWAAAPVPALSESQNANALSIGLPGGIALPTGLRRITSAERGVLSPVFGTSLNLARILISDGLGGGGRPFTAFVELPLIGGAVVLNCGPGFSGTADSRSVHSRADARLAVSAPSQPVPVHDEFSGEPSASRRHRERRLQIHRR